MKLNALLLSSTFILMAFTPLCFAQVVHYMTAEEAMRLAFPEADAFVQKFALADESQLAQISKHAGQKGLSSFFTYWAAMKGDSLLGFATEDNVIGKHQPITYVTAMDRNLKIISVEVLVYRESHGGQIVGEAYRKQYHGKDINSTLRLGRDIVNIARATLSCRHITDGIRKLTAYFTYLVAQEEGLVIDSNFNTEFQFVQKPIGIKSELNSEEAIYLKRERYLMGTMLSITSYAPYQKALEATESAFQEIARLESLISNWRTDSELSLINQSAGNGEWIEVSQETFEVISMAVQVANQSDGLFDPTISPLLNLWREAELSNSLPNSSDIESAKSLVHWQGILFHPTETLIRLSDAGMSIDLGGIGKGWALDKAADVIRNQGLQVAVLNFGGQILALDAPSETKGWEVSVHNKYEVVSEPLFLSNQSISVSASEERGFHIGDKLFSHIINPVDGYPVETTTCAIVISDKASIADAWSTVLLIDEMDFNRQVLKHNLKITKQTMNNVSGNFIAETINEEKAK